MYLRVGYCIKQVKVTGSLWENGMIFSAVSKPVHRLSLNPWQEKQNGGLKQWTWLLERKGQVPWERSSVCLNSQMGCSCIHCGTDPMEMHAWNAAATLASFRLWFRSPWRQQEGKWSGVSGSQEPWDPWEPLACVPCGWKPRRAS